MPAIRSALSTIRRVRQDRIADPEFPGSSARTDPVQASVRHVSFAPMIPVNPAAPGHLGSVIGVHGEPRSLAPG